jgi:hypothetical protein
MTEQPPGGHSLSSSKRVIHEWNTDQHQYSGWGNINTDTPIAFGFDDGFSSASTTDGFRSPFNAIDADMGVKTEVDDPGGRHTMPLPTSSSSHIPTPAGNALEINEPLESNLSSFPWPFQDASSIQWPDAADQDTIPLLKQLCSSGFKLESHTPNSILTSKDFNSPNLDSDDQFNLVSEGSSSPVSSSFSNHFLMYHAPLDSTASPYSSPLSNNEFHIPQVSSFILDSELRRSQYPSQTYYQSQPQVDIDTDRNGSHFSGTLSPSEVVSYKDRITRYSISRSHLDIGSSATDSSHFSSYSSVSGFESSPLSNGLVSETVL